MEPFIKMNGDRMERWPDSVFVTIFTAALQTIVCTHHPVLSGHLHCVFSAHGERKGGKAHAQKTYETATRGATGRMCGGGDNFGPSPGAGVFFVSCVTIVPISRASGPHLLCLPLSHTRHTLSRYLPHVSSEQPKL